MTDERARLSQQMAQERWKSHDAHLQRNVEFNISLAGIAMRAPALANAGAIAALLAFMSALNLEYESRNLYADSLVYFAVGLVASSISTAFAYLAQLFTSIAISLVSKKWIYPYLFYNYKYYIYNYLGIFFHIIAISSVLSGYIGLIGGGVAFYDAYF